jgi:bifunctional non-homologous end joining protein LigD
VPLKPRADGDTALGFTRAVVQHIAKVIPQRFVARTGAANRVGRIFVDYLRNRHASTTAAAYSARSRPGMGVSMPVTWEELAAIRSSDQWTVRTAPEHLALRKADPWTGYWGCAQDLDAGIAALGVTAGGDST